jgi:hypothetical protein
MDAMSTTASIAAGIAIVGALVAVAFLPARAGDEEPELTGAELPEAAAA